MLKGGRNELLGFWSLYCVISLAYSLEMGLHNSFAMLYTS